MATITGLTAERMLEIEGASVIDGEVVGGNLILTQHDGTQINAGPVIGPQGPVGPVGPAAVFAIPGEIKMWSGTVLPAQGEYGKWVWADGAVYVVATYPKAAAHIAPAWRTFGGASDPGAANFRAPDLRGLVPSGLDAMPGGARANRMTRAVAITIAARTGEEQHVIIVSEMPSHGHPVYNAAAEGHIHYVSGTTSAERQGAGNRQSYDLPTAISPHDHNFAAWSGGNSGGTGASIGGTGGNGAHENVQPTVFVPYIVKLDD